MTMFYFAEQDREGVVEPDIGFDLPDLQAAIDYARDALSDMALDGLPIGNGARYAVTVLGPDRSPIVMVSLRLSLEFCGGSKEHENRSNRDT
ncbi:hypothetical protein FHX15_005978 [Rhizobium sp. BK650]|uniref:DUF6894 family protein n=1 Tax=Rhizobium sp. BK650 TaxID=2586990 RepID=UPI001615867E|nr:hypothetical protein [Rhizobium sp. BK650]MBB3660707.1 hypothetical protein [Rhizobium sp. BK650]